MQRHLCRLGKSWSPLRFIQFRCKTYYEVLDVPPNATKKQIRDAFLEKSKKLHPDQNKNDPNTHEKFIELNTAYTALSKQASRLEYDRQLQHDIDYTGDDLGYRPTSQRPSPGFNRPPPGQQQNSKDWTYDGHDHRSAYEKYEKDMKNRAWQTHMNQQQQQQRAARFIKLAMSRMAIYFLFIWFGLSFIISALRRGAEARGVRPVRQQQHSPAQFDNRPELSKRVSEEGRNEKSDRELQQYTRARQAAVNAQTQKREKPRHLYEEDVIMDSGRQFKQEHSSETPTV